MNSVNMGIRAVSTFTKAVSNQYRSEPVSCCIPCHCMSLLPWHAAALRPTSPVASHELYQGYMHHEAPGCSGGICSA